MKTTIRKLTAEVAKMSLKADARPLHERCNCQKCVTRRSMTSAERRARHAELMEIARQRRAAAKGTPS